MAVAYMIGEATGVVIQNNIQTNQELLKDALAESAKQYIIREADCSGLKGEDKTDCKDANLIIHKSNAAVEHCVYSSHHDKDEMKACIDAVVKQREHDNKMHSDAMDEKVPKVDPVKLKSLATAWEHAKVDTTKAKVAHETAKKDADAARKAAKKADDEHKAANEAAIKDVKKKPEAASKEATAKAKAKEASDKDAAVAKA